MLRERERSREREKERERDREREKERERSFIFQGSFDEGRRRSQDIIRILTRQTTTTGNLV